MNSYVWRFPSLRAISFFFQAEDGIRDTSVTGVQTCALPICSCRTTAPLPCRLRRRTSRRHLRRESRQSCPLCRNRSEERRVGKECRTREAATQKKKTKEDRKGRENRKREENRSTLTGTVQA